MKIFRKCASLKCDKEFIPYRSFHKYCGRQCYMLWYNQIEKSKVAQAKYFRSVECKKVQAIYRQSKNCRTVNAKAQTKYYQTGKGKVIWSKWLQTDKGKAYLARMHSKRRILSTNPELYALRVLQLHTYQEPCAICGKPYHRTHCIDHILALCNGGIDEWSNYQPACIECHRIKTKEDLKIFYYQRQSRARIRN